MSNNHSSYNPAISFYSKVLTVFTFLLTVGGGLVTSTGSGLAIPDWPVAHGHSIAFMNPGVLYEFTHRLVATAVGMMILGLVFWQQLFEKRQWLRWFGIGTLALVVFQGVLGGLSVILKLPVPIIVFHATLAQSFFAVVFFLSFSYSKEWATDANGTTMNDDKINRLTLMNLFFIVVQLGMGSAYRHTDSHAILGVHILLALAVTLHSILIWKKDLSSYRAPSYLALASVLQVFLGFGAFTYEVILHQPVETSLTGVFFKNCSPVSCRTHSWIQYIALCPSAPSNVPKLIVLLKIYSTLFFLL